MRLYDYWHSAASYRVQYSATESFDDAKTLPTKGDPAITTSETMVTGLTTDKTYFVRVADVSDSGKVGTYSAATEARAAFKFEAPGDIFRTKTGKKKKLRRVNSGVANDPMDSAEIPPIDGPGPEDPVR